MDAITLGKPNMFAKGLVEQTYIDPQTGNIVGYDNVASEAAITTEVNLQEITGGFKNPVAGIIPDSTKLTGTYTSQAFSLQTRKLISGGKLHYDGVSSVCEKVTAAEGKITVSRTPVKHYAQPKSDEYAWCYVREAGASEYEGTNYSVDMTTLQVVNYTPVNGTEYEVFYFISNPSAEVLELPDNFNPSVIAINQKWGMYAKQNNSITQSTLQGYLYITIPLAVLSGDAGMTGSQTENSTTDGSWTALSPDNTVMDCADCGTVVNAMAYYVFVPCGATTQSVEALAIVGGGVSVKVNETAMLPLKYIMPDGSIAQPDFNGDDISYTVDDDTKATVVKGVITGLATGSTTVTATLGNLTSPAFTITVTQ